MLENNEVHVFWIGVPLMTLSLRLT